MKKNLALPFFIFILAFSPKTQADFSDVPQNSEYYQSITALENLGIVQGYENGQFDQSRLVSRAEFLKIAILTHSANMKQHFPDSDPVFPGIETIKMDSSCFFPDVKQTDWFAPYVCWAKKQGLISGYPDGNFYPYQTVNTSEAAKIMAIISYGEDSYIFNDDIYNPINKTQDHWANRYFEALAPQGLPAAIKTADQLLNRAITAEMAWRNLFASREDLESKPSNILVWNGGQFLNLEYLGSTQQDSYDYFYGKYDGKIYSIDGKNGFPFVLVEIPEADVNSFKIQYYKNGEGGMYLGVDKSGIYDMGKKVSESAGGFFEFFTEPPATHDYFYGAFRYMYGRDQENVYLINCFEGCEVDQKLPGADGNSFESLGDGYGKDAKNVFFKETLIQEADSASFDNIPSPASDVSFCRSLFSKDSNQVFIQSQAIEGVDPNSFEFLDSYGLYFRDKDHIYRTIADLTPACLPDKAVRLEADINTFKLHGSNYFTSEGKTYFINQKAEMVVFKPDLETFETFKDAKDDYGSYGGGILSKGLFAKDVNHVYYEGKVIEGADAATFAYNEEKLEWEDKNKTYEWTDF